MPYRHLYAVGQVINQPDLLAMVSLALSTWPSMSGPSTALNILLEKCLTCREPIHLQLG